MGPPSPWAPSSTAASAPGSATTASSGPAQETSSTSSTTSTSTATTAPCTSLWTGSSALSREGKKISSRFGMINLPARKQMQCQFIRPAQSKIKSNNDTFVLQYLDF